MAIEIKSFRRHEKNTLKGFVDVVLQPSGLEIRDLTLHEKQGNRWLNMPARPYTDTDGNTKYSYFVCFPDKTRAEQFQEAALKAFDEFVPPKPEPQQTGNQDDDSIPF